MGKTLAQMAGTSHRRGPALRLAAVSAVALLTANCSSNTQKFAGGPSGNGIDPKYGVKASPRLYNEGDVIPKGGGRRFSGKPYMVAGKTYVPREDAKGYVREGLASWYGSAFHGRMTANGEVFDRHSIAAAHPTLPLPSYARVTNLENGYSMVVRVNDRGPYHAGRVMDISEEAARALDFHRKGTARVRVAYIGKASVAGSDDRKLMATLRTDGQPAGLRSPVMVADLGPSEEPVESFAKPARAPLAFKPAPEAEPEEAPRPARRPAPVLVASAAVAVPPALQPTAPRAAAFRAAPVAGLNPVGQAAGMPGQAAGRPGQAADRPGPAPMRLAAGPAAKPAAPAKGAPTHLAARPVAPAAMPASAKLAMARLTATAAPAPKGDAKAGKSPEKGAPAKLAAGPAAKPPGRHTDRLAGIY
ncbi:septal ring lytic transglycosylase RlpA family protein [Methylobacterium dankookense]|uniref:Endolytic peptidoglycan transglycosylase RlpA n=1 Tax=Methylobacterium dankookense TaxID=560405 RepID=A0A564G5L4_9HYPH|nr:septal ring lytic transglycosylase RlpA family protein [Methylobacterium dankookense]VUF15833.1 Endolytic peptidoglycan transglycosylase RlpA [Methylobacterium dankookense]